MQENLLSSLILGKKCAYFVIFYVLCSKCGEINDGTEELKRSEQDWNVCDGLYRNRQRVIYLGSLGEKCYGEILWFQKNYLSLHL